MVWYLIIFLNIKKCQNIQIWQFDRTTILSYDHKQADRYNYFILWLLFGLYMALLYKRSQLTLNIYIVASSYYFENVMRTFIKKTNTLRNSCITGIKFDSFPPTLVLWDNHASSHNNRVQTISPVHNFRQITQEILSLAFITINDHITNIQREQNTKIVIYLSYKFHICL